MLFWKSCKGKVCVILFYGMALSSCSGSYLHPTTSSSKPANQPENLTEVLEPLSEDKPFFEAIAEDQEKQLGSCKNESECQMVHFLRGLAALYDNRELAALHFRKVVAFKPSSTLAKESRFWLWFLDVLNSPSQGGMTSNDLIKRLTREVVERELTIHELTAKLENASVEALQQELGERKAQIDTLNQTILSLKKQTEQQKNDQAKREEAEKALTIQEKKVKELTEQLEALRRIDKEIREKAPPTRPSEKMTPVPEASEATGKEEPIKEKDTR